MKNKKLIVAIVLCVAGVLSVIYGIIAPTKGKKSTRSQASEPTETAAPAKKIVPTERRAKKTEFTSWGRNPFLPKGAPGAAGSAFVLEGIMWSEKNPKAMINSTIVEIGDEIGGNKIIDIKKDRVILSDGTEKITLRMETQDSTPKGGSKK